MVKEKDFEKMVVATKRLHIHPHKYAQGNRVYFIGFRVCYKCHVTRPRKKR